MLPVRPTTFSWHFQQGRQRHGSPVCGSQNKFSVFFEANQGRGRPETICSLTLPLPESISKSRHVFLPIHLSASIYLYISLQFLSLCLSEALFLCVYLRLCRSASLISTFLCMSISLPVFPAFFLCSKFSLSRISLYTKTAPDLLELKRMLIHLRL